MTTAEGRQEIGVMQARGLVNVRGPHVGYGYIWPMSIITQVGDVAGCACDCFPANQR
jgi:hypothetical protein